MKNLNENTNISGMLSNNISNSNINNDSSINKDVNIKKYIHNKIKPKRISKEEIEKQKKKTMRPHLKDKVGKLITCFGYVVGKYGDYSDLYTVINVIDINGRYAADHIQLDFKENEYDYTYDRGCYIRFTGRVIEYNRSNGTSDYTIDIIDKVSMFPSKYYYNEDINDHVDFDVSGINNILSRSNMTKVYNILENIRDKINDLTDYYFMNDFIYYYVINQYMLNTVAYNIYDGELRDQGFDDNIILDIIMILGSTLYDLTHNEQLDLSDILSSICYKCNVIQGVFAYNGLENNPKFMKFIQKNIGLYGKRKCKAIWYFILQRKMDFKESNPNPENITKQQIQSQKHIVL